MNRYLHPDTYEHKLNTADGPLAKFAGQVAFEQLSDNLDFVNEQPTGSYLYGVEPWPKVLQDPRVFYQLLPMSTWSAQFPGAACEEAH